MSPLQSTDPWESEMIGHTLVFIGASGDSLAITDHLADPAGQDGIETPSLVRSPDPELQR